MQNCFQQGNPSQLLIMLTAMSYTRAKFLINPKLEFRLERSPKITSSFQVLRFWLTGWRVHYRKVMLSAGYTCMSLPTDRAYKCVTL